jgi:hypothetical protein
VERRELHTDRASGAKTVALDLAGDLGMSWAEACAALKEANAAAATRGEAVSPMK